MNRELMVALAHAAAASRSKPDTLRRFEDCLSSGLLSLTNSGEIVVHTRFSDDEFTELITHLWLVTYAEEMRLSGEHLH